MEKYPIVGWVNKIWGLGHPWVFYRLANQTNGTGLDWINKNLKLCTPFTHRQGFMDNYDNIRHIFFMFIKFFYISLKNYVIPSFQDFS
jgi:hypothetical protein